MNAPDWPTAPAGYRECRSTGGTNLQTTHLVKIAPTGGTPGPTACGLSRFDTLDPKTGSVIAPADLPGWSMGGGVYGLGITQVACADCFTYAEGESALVSRLIDLERRVAAMEAKP